MDISNFGLLVCLLPLLACAAPVGAPARTTAACIASEEQLHVKSATATLEGTLTMPALCGRRPVVLVVPGSGPTDRDGNNRVGVSAQPYRMLAEALADRGVGTLRYDKAGVGLASKSSLKEEDLRFETGADDVAALVRALRQDGRVGAVTIVGHSEGSLVGMLAAEQEPVDGFVSLAGAGRPIGEILREQLATSLPDASLLARANETITLLERGELAPAPKELAALFRPSVQPYLVSWMKYDPAKELTKLQTKRISIVQGTTDIQVGVGDARRLAGARPDARLALLDGVNHVLKAVSADPSAQRASYTDPSQPLAPSVVDEVVRVASGQR